LNEPISKSSLSPSEQRLVELLQEINFGRVEHLQIRGGQPVFDPPPDIIQTRKLGSHTVARQEASLDDFWLRLPVVDLVQTIREFGHGEIRLLTVLHGLPHVLEIRQHGKS
jgi:hypothetical protein